LNASGSSVDTSGGSLEAFEVSAFASERLSMANTTLDLASISLAARTVTLQDVDFPSGSTVSLSSSLGLLAPNPNTLAPVRTGMVNFIQNVTYGEVPAQDFVPISVGGNAPIGSERIFINTFNP